MNAAVTAKTFKNLQMSLAPEKDHGTVFFQFRSHDPEANYTESVLHLSGTDEELRKMLREWAHAEGYVLTEVPA